MKPRRFDDLPEACKYCKNIIGLETDECKCRWADDNFEWEIMDSKEGELVACIRFEYGLSRSLEGVN